MRPSVLLALLLAAPVASAREKPAATEAPVHVDAGEPEEIVVYGDRFARWDGTRWFVDIQVGMPLPYPLYAAANHEFEAVAVQIREVLACDKTWRRGKRRHEVDCVIEDIGIQAAGWRTHDPYAEEILEALDRKLTGAKIQLIVADDGRLTNIDLEGLEGDNDREKAIREQARMLLVRAMVGFHMRLPPENHIRNGQWVEYDAPLFQMPVVLDRRRLGEDNATTTRAPTLVNSLGGSYIIHQLDRYKGHNVVQSVGEGTILIDQGGEDKESWFKIKLDGVAIYDDAGVMTERVWALRGRTTAGSYLADGRADSIYFHNGRIRMLGKEEKADVGPTRRVSRPGVTVASLPPWEPLE